ncbi:hypothetical protein CACET_c27380 [Clostridium aceticum]|uniref:Uncharacterized protein n=1 Tax=Clostridium aceticum TaxID=84022 RepID=A0A0G3WCV2_9CLOT|nr:hypothetical protein [Clostridium aceticum]AKL96183.1 hypothetical protein CACET_c27380 [Clostridium aceticum]
MLKNIKAEQCVTDIKEDSKFIRDANFERCIDFMVRVIEKYSHEIEIK